MLCDALAFTGILTPKFNIHSVQPTPRSERGGGGGDARMVVSRISVEFRAVHRESEGNHVQ